MMAKPFSIRVFIEDGEPTGVRSVTKSNWDGMCIAIPRGAGVLQESDGCYRFGEDYEFSSPSTAASVILGNNSNGRLAWKNRTGRTLADLEADEVQA